MAEIVDSYNVEDLLDGKSIDDLDLEKGDLLLFRKLQLAANALNDRKIYASMQSALNARFTECLTVGMNYLQENNVDDGLLLLEFCGLYGRNDLATGLVINTYLARGDVEDAARVFIEQQPGNLELWERVLESGVSFEDDVDVLTRAHRKAGTEPTEIFEVAHLYGQTSVGIKIAAQLGLRMEYLNSRLKDELDATVLEDAFGPTAYRGWSEDRVDEFLRNDPENYSGAGDLAARLGLDERARDLDDLVGPEIINTNSDFAELFKKADKLLEKGETKAAYETVRPALDFMEEVDGLQSLVKVFRERYRSDNIKI
jgi:hypothetical protein